MLEEIRNLGNQSAEKLLESILGSAINGIMSFKAIRKQEEIVDFECLFCNDIASDILKSDKDDLKGKKLLSIMPESQSSGLFEKCKSVAETGKVDTLEQHFSNGDDDRWLKVSAVKLDDGITITFEDITDLKQAFLDTENREKKYRKLFEESLDPIFLIDEDHRIKEANTALKKLFSFGWSELEDKKFGTLFQEETEFKGFVTELQEKGEVEEMEATLVAKNNSDKICLINCAALQYDDKEPVSYIGVIRDMTRKKQAEKELILAEKLSMTGKLARTIAHEVRNPLTNLSLALEQLRDEIPEEVEDAELYLNIIKRNSERISKLISDLLNSSKPKDLKLEKRSVNDQMREAISLVGDRLKLMNINIIEDYDPEIPDIPLDRDQINVAFLNLLINAIEAMKADEGELKITTSKEGDLIRLLIKDNGKGISEKHMGKVFEPFFTSKKDGNGLGLTTVQNIIHGHKGQISAKSTVGSGTELEIRFYL